MTTKSISDPRADFDRLSAKLQHLQVMLQMTYGCSAENFAEFSDERRDTYMWACATMARECSEIAEQLIGPAIYRNTHDISPT